MKIKTRPDDADLLEGDELFQMNGWLAELRDDDRAEPQDEDRTASGDEGRAASRDDSYPGPQEHRYAGPQEHSYAGSREDARIEPPDDGRAMLRHDGQARPPRHAYPRSETLAATPVTRPIARTRTTMRAVIGDRLRLPMMWCEMDSCICWYAHPAALGEADARARAIDAGWRVDAVGLLVCPR